MVPRILLALLPLLLHNAAAQRQQSFRVTPYNTRVVEGREARLPCEVDHQQGSVQWTKDGFALGYASVIPGFPRYAMLGDASRGVYNLRISNASLEDDAEFQCQVGPKGRIAAIRANATLTVLSGRLEIVNRNWAFSQKCADYLVHTEKHRKGSPLNSSVPAL
ncbi:irregular chiasm C-roughest protein-like [Thrips palmi]|uniref:Irregular chiasm C-roughest protein-like n=1 Tax=Thrips palmi TaxID=161013 RepID=A0A6P8ZH97_THRPL|nr:irregular chiasm C-roughest protein-like [Thrips palmi]